MTTSICNGQHPAQILTQLSMHGTCWDAKSSSLTFLQGTQKSWCWSFRFSGQTSHSYRSENSIGPWGDEFVASFLPEEVVHSTKDITDWSSPLRAQLTLSCHFFLSNMPAIKLCLPKNVRVSHAYLRIVFFRRGIKCTIHKFFSLQCGFLHIIRLLRICC